MEVIRNIMYVTTAGMVANWWFILEVDQRKTIWNAFKCAITTSFGSICFGSFLATHIFSCPPPSPGSRHCDLRQFDPRKLLTSVPYPRVAIYGRDLLTSQAETFSLIDSRGFDIVVDNHTMGIVVFLISISGGIICGILGAMVGLYYLGFVYGYCMFRLFLTILRSAITTTYMVWADDSTLLHQNHSAEYKTLCDAANLTYGGQRQW